MIILKKIGGWKWRDRYFHVIKSYIAADYFFTIELIELIPIRLQNSSTGFHSFREIYFNLFAYYLQILFVDEKLWRGSCTKGVGRGWLATTMAS